MSTKITSVDPHSPAEKAGIQVGEQLLAINGHTVVDVLDYRFYGYDALCHVELAANGKNRTLTIHKEEGQDLGLNFETYLIDTMHRCANHCVFCFIDQMPKGMRESLYVKDDDERLSFLLGNYTTLTNLSEREAQRIIDLHISPINVSVHTTNPQLRSKMLGNKDAAKSLDYMRAFGKAGIQMNGQIVVCPGWNDGAELRRTMQDLMDIGFASCSVVPVGLTDHRQGLAKLKAVDAETAGSIIAIADEFGAKCLKEKGTRLFFCADELYLKAGLLLPEDSYYEEYRQLENGVGLLRSLEQEFLASLRLTDEVGSPAPFTIATGVSAAPFLEQLLRKAQEKFPRIQGKVIAVENDFFGHKIDVAGLLTGQDIAAQCQGKLLGNRLLIPLHMLRHGETVFLDDYTTERLGEELNTQVQIVGLDGGDLFDCMIESE